MFIEDRSLRDAVRDPSVDEHSQDGLMDWARAQHVAPQVTPATLQNAYLSFRPSAFPWPALRTLALSRGAIPSTMVASLLRVLETRPDAQIVVLADGAADIVQNTAFATDVASRVRALLGGPAAPAPINVPPQ